MLALCNLDLKIFISCPLQILAFNHEQTLFKKEFRGARIYDNRISGNPSQQVEDFQDDVNEDFDENSDVVETESEPVESGNDESEQDELEPAESEEDDSEITEDVEDEEQDLDNGGKLDLPK